MRTRTRSAVALILVCGLAAYSNGFADRFVGLDGKESIRDNPHIRQLWPLSEALSLPLCVSSIVPEQHPTVACRPTFSLVLALTHHVFGLQPSAYFGVNLAIHLTAALVLFAIIRRTLRRQRLDAIRSHRLALAAALIWLLHPLQTESVTYVVQACETLMGLMLLGALYCAIRGLDGDHRRWWQAGAVAACALSIGSKPTAIVAPLLVLLYDHIFVSASARPRYRPGLYAVMTAIAALAVLALPVSGIVTAEKTFAYAITQPGVILHYLRLSLWPDDLFLYINTKLFAVDSLAQALLPALVLVGLFAATLWGIARRQWFGFLGGWFFLTLAPTSSLIPITDRIQEHRMYLPLAAVAVLAVIGGDALLRAVLTPRFSERVRTAASIGLLAVVALGLGARTYARNWDYHHEFTMVHPADLHEDYTILADHYLTQDALLETEARNARLTLSAPDQAVGDVVFAHFVLGLAAYRKDELQEAASELERALRGDPGFAYGHYHLGRVLRRQGNPTGAVESLREAIRLEPGLVYAYKELALALKEEGDSAGAIQILEQALRVQPRFGEGHYELGIIALERGDPDAAAEQFRQALRDQPDLAEAQYELGMIALERGDTETAERHFASAVGLRSDLTEAHFELGMLWRDRGDFDQAALYLGNAVRLRPDSADLLTELGRVELKRRRTDAAVEHFRRALAIDPEFTDASEELGAVQRSLQKPAAANN